MYSINLIKNAEQKESTPRNPFIGLYEKGQAQRHQYSMFDVGRSMFDV